MDSVSLLPTESMKRIFIPLWNRVTELTIVTAEDYDLYQLNGSESLINPLLSMSEDIIRSLKDLSVVCKQTVSLRYPSDAVAKQEVDFCSQSMMMAGESLVLGCHILCSKKKSDMHTPLMPQQMQLSSCVTDLYQCLILLLLAIDDAEVRKIINLGIASTKALTSLATANSLQTLNDFFRSLAIPITSFYNLVIVRCDDVSDTKFQEDLRCAVVVLRQSLPMLATALQMAIKYPDQQKAIKGRDYCVNQLHKAILEINKKIALKHIRKSMFPGLNHGIFHELLSSIKNFLSIENRSDPNLTGLSYIVQSFIQHALELSLNLPKGDKETKNIHVQLVASCRKLMKTDRELENHCKNQGGNKERNEQETNEKCINLIAASEAAMIPIKDAIIIFTVRTFVPMERPLVDLIQACIDPDIGILDDTKTTNQKKARCELKVDELVENFVKYTESVKRATNFSASCCETPSIYLKYEEAVRRFEEASKAAGVAISEYRVNRKENDLFVSEQVRNAKDYWTAVFHDIISLVALSLDLRCLLDYIMKTTTAYAEKCLEGVVNLDSNLTAEYLHKLTGLSVLLEKVGHAVVSNSATPVYRNGVLSHVKKLNDSIANCTGFGNELLEDTGRVEAQGMFTATLKNLLETLQATSRAILSDSNHPDITSARREFVRSENVSVLNSDLMLFSSEDERNLSRAELKNERHTVIETSGKNDDSASRKSSGSIPAFKPSNPVVINLLSCLDEDGDEESTANNLENAKKLFSEACDLNLEIARNTLVESSLCKLPKQKGFVMKKSSEAIQTLRDLIIKDIERITEDRGEKRDSVLLSEDIESLNILAAQWSQASSKLTNESMTALSLYVVPIRRYFVYFLDVLTDEQKTSVTKSLVPYPGYKNILLDNMASVINSNEWDDSSFADFNVHEKNVGELIRLVNAVTDLVPSEIDEDKHGDIIRLCDTVCEDWEKSCNVKEETQALIEMIASGECEPADKVSLQLHCLEWSSKIHTIHVNALKAAKLLLAEFEIKLEDFPLTSVILNANDSRAKDIANYKRTLANLLEYHGSYNFGQDSMTATWSDNLKLTKEVMEQIFDFLSSIRSAVPLIYHHGHSMFHLMHLHHLFFVMLAYLMLAKSHEKKHAPDFGDRPTLSSRLKSLKEERERQSDSLNDLLQTVPKLDI